MNIVKKEKFRNTRKVTKENNGLIEIRNRKSPEPIISLRANPDFVSLTICVPERRIIIDKIELKMTR